MVSDGALGWERGSSLVDVPQVNVVSLAWSRLSHLMVHLAIGLKLFSTGCCLCQSLQQGITFVCTLPNTLNCWGYFTSDQVDL